MKSLRTSSTRQQIRLSIPLTQRLVIPTLTLVTLPSSQNELLYNQVQLVNFVLAELSTHSKVISKDIISFKSKDVVYKDRSVENIMALRANTNEGTVEVRVTSVITENLADYEKAKKEGLHSIKTFYESVSRNYLQKAPSFSHSRVMAYEQNIDAMQTTYQKIKKLVIEVEEDLGPEFPYEIMYQIEQYVSQRRGQPFKDEITLDNRSEVVNSSRLANSMAYMANKSYIENKQKGSLIAFVWGALLSTYTRKVEQTGIKLALKSGLYKEYRQDPLLGQIGFNENNFKKDEQKNYLGVLERLKSRKDAYDKMTLKVIENKLKTIFKSEVYSLYREEEVMAYCPKYIDVENLRIFRKDKNLKLEKKEEDIYGRAC